MKRTMDINLNVIFTLWTSPLMYAKHFINMKQVCFMCSRFVCYVCVVSRKKSKQIGRSHNKWMERRVIVYCLTVTQHWSRNWLASAPCTTVGRVDRIPTSAIRLILLLNVSTVFQEISLLYSSRLYEMAVRYSNISSNSATTSHVLMFCRHFDCDCLHTSPLNQYFDNSTPSIPLKNRIIDLL